MPSLQDLLEDFDPSHLEELAESLLADVTTEFEGNASRSSPSVAETESTTEPLLRPLVGTKTEELEPCQDINGGLSTPTRRVTKPIKQELDSMPMDDAYDSHLLTIPATITTNAAAKPALTKKSNSLNKSISIAKTSNNACLDTDKMLYGTYDEENNCITVMLPEEDISNYEEVIEEIVCNDEDDEYLSQIPALSPIPTNYPSPGYSSYSGQSYHMKSPLSDRDSAYDSMLGSPLGRSAASSIHYSDDDFHYTDNWPDSFSELFPSLA